MLFASIAGTGRRLKIRRPDGSRVADNVGHGGAGRDARQTGGRLYCRIPRPAPWQAPRRTTALAQAMVNLASVPGAARWW